MRITPFFCLLLIYLCPKAQLQTPVQGKTASGKTQFLWFSGHWSSSKKNVFIVDNATPGGNAGAGGSGTVTVNPDGTISASGGSQDEWNKTIDAGIQQINDWVNKLNSPANNLDPDEYNMNRLLLPDALEQQALWNGYKIEKGQDLLSPDTKPAQSTGNGKSGESPGKPTPPVNPAGDMGDLIKSFCEKAKADYNTVIEYYNSHRKDQDMNIPPPPEFEYSCYACDSDLRKVYDTTITHYVRDFMHPEDSMILKAQTLLRNYILLIGAGNEQTQQYTWGKSAVCNYFNPDELSNAVLGIARHLYQRAEKLVDQYHSRFKAGETIARTFFKVSRTYIMITESSNQGTDATYFPLIAEMELKNLNFYFDKLSHNDWKQVGNITYDISLMRNAALMNGGDESSFDNNLAKIIKIFNGFSLSIDMDVKIGTDDGYWISHLKGDCKVAPVFIEDSNQCYKWVVVDENSKDAFGFYKSKQLQEIDCQLITNQMMAPNGSPTYVGTKKFKNTLKGLRMDFCNPGKDTIILGSFVSDPPGNAIWSVPGGPPQALGITGDNLFADETRQKQLQESGKATEQMAVFKKENEETVAQIKSLAAQIKNETGDKKMEDYQKMMALLDKSKSSAPSNGVMAKMLFLDFEIPVQNNSQVLVDQTFEAAKINPGLSKAIIYANYKVHIENKGNSGKN
jgi:hypothetical protein